MQTPHTNVDPASVLLFFFFFFLIFLSSFCLFLPLTNSLATMVVAALLHRDTWTLVKLRPTVFFPCASPHSSTLSSHFLFFTPHQFPPCHHYVLYVRSRIQNMVIKQCYQPPTLPSFPIPLQLITKFLLMSCGSHQIRGNK